MVHVHGELGVTRVDLLPKKRVVSGRSTHPRVTPLWSGDLAFFPVVPLSADSLRSWLRLVDRELSSGTSTTDNRSGPINKRKKRRNLFVPKGSDSSRSVCPTPMITWKGRVPTRGTIQGEVESPTPVSVLVQVSTEKVKSG